MASYTESTPHPQPPAADGENPDAKGLSPDTAPEMPMPMSAGVQTGMDAENQIRQDSALAAAVEPVPGATDEFGIQPFEGEEFTAV